MNPGRSAVSVMVTASCLAYSVLRTIGFHRLSYPVFCRHILYLSLRIQGRLTGKMGIGSEATILFSETILLVSDMILAVCTVPYHL